MEVGDWVKFRYNNIDRTGYIVDIFKPKIIIYQTSPKISHPYAKITLYDNGNYNIRVQNNVEIEKSEIPTLIDLALKMNDKVWFMELTNKLKNEKRGISKVDL